MGRMRITLSSRVTWHPCREDYWHCLSRHDSVTCQPHLAIVESVMKQEGKPLGSVDNEAEYVVTHTSSAQEPSPWGEVTPSPWTSSPGRPPTSISTQMSLTFTVAHWAVPEGSLAGLRVKGGGSRGKALM